MKSIENLPKEIRRLNLQLESVQNENSVTTQILASGVKTKDIGALLATVQQNLPSRFDLKDQLKLQRKQLVKAELNRVLWQERTRKFNVDPVTLDNYFENWKVRHVNATDLTESQKQKLRPLRDARKKIVTDLTSASIENLELLASMVDSTETLMVQTTSLSNELRQSLIWLPSNNAFSSNWQDAGQAGLQWYFSPRNWIIAAKDLWRGAISHFLRTGLLIGLIILFWFRRSRININPLLSLDQNRAGISKLFIGSFAAFLRSIELSVLVPAFLIAIGLTLKSGATTNFSNALSHTLIILAGLIFVLRFMRVSCRDGALFDKNIDIGRPLRTQIRASLIWFTPLQISSVFVFRLSSYSSNTIVHDTFGLIAFLISAAGLTVIAWKIVRSVNSNKSEQTSFVRKIFPLFLIGTPVVLGIIALIGYFRTAFELQGKFFLTILILLVGYILMRSVHQVLHLIGDLKREIDSVNEISSARISEIAQGKTTTNITEKNGLRTHSEKTDAIQFRNLINSFVFFGIAFGLWIVWQSFIPALGVLDDVTLMTQQIGSGENLLLKSITLQDIFIAGLILILTTVAARNLPGFLELLVLRNTNLDAGAKYAAVTIIGYAIVAVGSVVALSKAGLQWSQLQWFVAALSLGIGFGMQEIVANFISGIILLFERPVRIGDYVTIGAQSGTVSRIQIRAVTLQDLDRRETVIPNKKLITDDVTNWSLSDSVVRLSITVGIAYGSDTTLARKLMLQALQENENVLNDPVPAVLFSGFGDSSLNFEMRGFIFGFENLAKITSELHLAVDAAFREHKVEIPFPQRVLHHADSKT
ncbi:MAG: mechanosensitive ion channel [Hyphomonadaceae bacterium]|nr:mechanosensitive ion channel [Hyphomonadaceae bacterium]